MTDRRRVNGPASGTSPPVFTSPPRSQHTTSTELFHTRTPNDPRRTFLKTGLTPSASGSAYFELEPSPAPFEGGLISLTTINSGLKLSCTVHGPRPLPRSALFSPHLLLSTHIKFAPFAARQRRGYLRDASEKDLSVHLETALRGVIIGERWPKSGLEIIVTVLEGEEDCPWNGEREGSSRIGGWGMMSVLSGCITVASAAIADAGVDCVGLVTGGMAAIVTHLPSKAFEGPQKHLVKEAESAAGPKVVIDPCPSEHQEISAACVVAYLQSRDEITELWAKGDAMGSAINQSSGQIGLDVLMDHAVEAATAARLVLIEAISESSEIKLLNHK
ncbi:3'-5'-exoribonuclease [Pseudocyphellaria aurata]|nr:3'-5'-exoribonuclease [Pseudocyphellaria aurata]